MNNFTLRKLKEDRKHYKNMKKNPLSKEILKKINEAITIVKNKNKLKRV